MRVLDASRPRGATWSGQVISSPTGASGGPSEMHLLPGGGVLRVHRAWSPVPPKLPLFATPRSVRPFAALAAGAYPPRRPPNAWSPGVPALPGPCYWLVTSGTPVGWRGGCRALGLVRGAMRHYCLGRCSALVVCVRRPRPVRGGLGPVPGVVSSLFPPARPVFPALCVAGRPVWVSLILARWYAIPCGLCVPRARSGCPSGFPCVSFVCVCALALSRRPRPAPPPPRVGVARAPRAVPVLGAGRAVPLRPCPSVCPASVSCSVWLALGGGGRSHFPLPGLGLRAPRGVGAGVGTRHQPHRARSCVLTLRAGLASCRGGTRAPGGAPLAWLRGARGPALSQPQPLVLSGVRPGPTTHWLCVRGVRARGPVTIPTARALASWLCALWGRHEGAPGGRLLPGCGASGVGRSPTRDHSSFRACGRGPLPCGFGCGGCGRGDLSPTPQRALLRAGFARCGRGMRVPGGGASCLLLRRPGTGALPPPTSCPFGRPAGPTTHWLWVRGLRAWGPVTNPTARALPSWLCALWGRQEGA